MKLGPVASWIVGLMAENSEAVGFIPSGGVQEQYVENGRYVLQHDDRGRRVGYLLHGLPTYGRALNVAQHCIQHEYRRRGHGERALSELVGRAERAGCPAISARCATDLESLSFWLSEGFELRDVVPGGQRRGRAIARLWLPLRTPMDSWPSRAEGQAVAASYPGNRASVEVERWGW